MVELKAWLVANMDTIGWVGNSLLAICGLPQALKSFKNGHSKGISYLFLWSWYIGEWLAFMYHLGVSDKYPQILNYVFNLVFITIVIWFRHFERKETKCKKITNLGTGK